LLSDTWLERLANLRDRAEIDLALAGHHRRIPEGGTHPWRT
jgi:hypothetical protein